MSFPNGSSGGPDGFRPQHLKDLISHSTGDGGQLLLNALVTFVSLVLEGITPLLIHPYLLEHPLLH